MLTIIDWGRDGQGCHDKGRDHGLLEKHDEVQWSCVEASLLVRMSVRVTGLGN